MRALTLLMVVACSSSSPLPVLRLLEVSYEGGTACIVREVGVKPYAYACESREYLLQPGPPTNVDPVSHHELLARLGEVCSLRPVGCLARACLGPVVACPPPEPREALPTDTWFVVRTGDRCKIAPQPPTDLSPTPAVYEIACPAAYAEPIVSIRRNHDYVSGGTDLYHQVIEPCVIDDGQECPKGSRCEPEPPRYTPCPVRPDR